MKRGVLTLLVITLIVFIGGLIAFSQIPDAPVTYFIGWIALSAILVGSTITTWMRPPQE